MDFHFCSVTITAYWGWSHILRNGFLTLAHWSLQALTAGLVKFLCSAVATQVKVTAVRFPYCFIIRKEKKTSRVFSLSWADGLTLKCLLMVAELNPYTDKMIRLLLAESEEELKSFLMRVKEESDKAGLKLNIQKTKIMHSVPSWQI